VLSHVSHDGPSGGSCKYGNELSGSTEGDGFIESLFNCYQLLKFNCYMELSVNILLYLMALPYRLKYLMETTHHNFSPGFLVTVFYSSFLYFPLMFTEQVSLEVMLEICIREMLSSNLGRPSSILF
jgi:hypothetical protein